MVESLAMDTLPLPSKLPVTWESLSRYICPDRPMMLPSALASFAIDTLLPVQEAPWKSRPLAASAEPLARTVPRTVASLPSHSAPAVYAPASETLEPVETPFPLAMSPETAMSEPSQMLLPA